MSKKSDVTRKCQQNTRFSNRHSASANRYGIARRVIPARIDFYPDNPYTHVPDALLNMLKFGTTTAPPPPAQIASQSTTTAEISTDAKNLLNKYLDASSDAKSSETKGTDEKVVTEVKVDKKKSLRFWKKKGA
jgi:hypothetical protein